MYAGGAGIAARADDTPGSAAQAIPDAQGRDTTARSSYPPARVWPGPAAPRPAMTRPILRRST